MNRTTLVFLALFATACEDDDFVEKDYYFIKLDKDAQDVASAVQTISNAFSVEPIHIYDSSTKGFTAKIPVILADDVRKFDNVRKVIRDSEKEIIIPDDSSDIELGDDEVPEGMVRIGAPYLGSLDFSGVHVAVIDTGVDGGHVELNVVAEADLVGERTGDWADGTDPNGHGTHVAGTIGAAADGEGVVGVAPSVPIHAVRVLDAAGSGTYGDIVAGLEYVIDNPDIRVVNMSLGGYSSPEVDEILAEPLQALEDAGVIVCIAAGNNTEDTAGFTPANLDYGIVVSAYDAAGGTDNGFAWFSNYGDAVDITAPGVDIMSTWPGGGYDGLSGTSMATPHVAGAMAIYRAYKPNTTVANARSTLIDSAEAGLAGKDGSHPEPMLDLPALIDAID